MSEEQFERTNMSRTQRRQMAYDDLYSDLPKEVADILIEEHPLLGKEEKIEMTARRRPAREDVEEVKEARMQKVSSEIKEIKQAPQQEGEPTRHVSRRARSQQEAEMSQTMAPSSYEEEAGDGIQYVSVLPARKKQKMVEEITLQTFSHTNPKRKKAPKAPQPFEPEGRPRYEEMDFEKKAKENNLDVLYDGEEYEDDFYGGRSKLSIILGILGMLLIVFLIFRSVSLSNELTDLKGQLATIDEVNEKYESLQIENMQLQEQLDALQNPAPVVGSETAEQPIGLETEDAPQPEAEASSSATVDSYTVVAGDTIWTIAEKLYGNGVEGQRIIDANGLEQSDPTLNIGDVLIIP